MKSGTLSLSFEYENGIYWYFSSVKKKNSGHKNSWPVDRHVGTLGTFFPLYSTRSQMGRKSDTSEMSGAWSHTPHSLNDSTTLSTSSNDLSLVRHLPNPSERCRNRLPTRYLHVSLWDTPDCLSDDVPSRNWSLWSSVSHYPLQSHFHPSKATVTLYTGFSHRWR